MIWYVAYGSNLLAQRFHAYLQGSDADSDFGAHTPAPSAALPVRDTWLEIEHALYFAGVSKRWGGSSAFVTLEPHASSTTPGHAYLIEDDQFAHVAASENAVDHVEVVVPPPGGWTQLALDPGLEPHRGKYDAVVRLPNIDGIAAVTLTTSVERQQGMPSDRYAAVIRSAPEPPKSDKYRLAP